MPPQGEIRTETTRSDSASYAEKQTYVLFIVAVWIRFEKPFPPFFHIFCLARANILFFTAAAVISSPFPGSAG